MKKLCICRMIKLIALLLPIAFFILFNQTYLFCYYDINVNRLNDFYNEPENSLDVVIMGASDVCTGFAPGYAYDKYGYTSYAYAMDSNPGPLYKAQLKEVLKKQNPGLIIIEIEGFLHDNDENQTDEARLRLFAESIPMSLNKLEAIFQHPYEDKLSCLFPFIKYHGNWQNTEELRYRYVNKSVGFNDPARLKNIYTYTMIHDQEPIYDIQNDYTVISDISPMCRDGLIDLLEYCQQEQLDNVVFVRFPHKTIDNISYLKYCQTNGVEEILRQYNYPLLNFERKAEEIGIDYQTDFFDNDHLNVYGQMKMTDYLSKWIINEYQLTPITQTDVNKALWEECAAYTYAYFRTADQYTKEGKDSFIGEDPELMALLDNIVKDMGTEAL